MIAMLDREGLTDRARLVVEKPFGLDLQSSRNLDAALKEVVDEEQVFRIDHFLGKEAVQNILALRFANGLFEPAWDARSIASVQIDVPETLGMEGRGSFYESTGCLRDMVSTHLSQLLGFVALEDPDDLDERRSATPSRPSSPPCARSTRTVSSSASTTATATRRTSTRTPTWRRSSRWRCTSTTTAGATCRSTSAPARRWPRPGARSRCGSGPRRARCWAATSAARTSWCSS